ncbi:hypothetical protein EXW72_01055 [Pseudomonas sp. BCA14]|uniref:hypothetical protein n=1 Tax=unclassified Pseudomonas TaxID=196821 RepID=UPI00106ECAC2|nr:MULTISPECIES: hypothetical protein [unclassified Pseudomonas]TFF13448.1 hypothetical protein EXW70_02635 [Pseudomonas sp. JMN1]TFF15868.1 hypothetical protein EXW71_06405 [Pseudomonas sp. BCA17]TFF29804.1 hypothetical protein EXW73_05640 [Pseudomonas sp. BCA13]TFF30646.1 hypothetical protein EXW72_01055 [Pseudomonas sp. BCA14]
MKSSVVWWRCVSAHKSLFILLGVLTVSASEDTFASEWSISKTMTPGSVLVLSNSTIDPATGFSVFYIISADIPAGTLIDPKQLLEIQWKTTYYPQSTQEDVHLCYSRPYSSQENCERIYPNSSGTLSTFNDQAFGNGSRVKIKHSVLGGTPPLNRPAGVDSVTFRYRY